MSPHAIDLFEELRFVWELYAAELLFLSALAPRRARFAPLAACGLACFSLLSLAALPLKDAVSNPGLPDQLVGLFYIVLALLMIAYLRLCFAVSLPDALFVGILSYAAQHVVYAVVHEALALWVAPAMTEHIFAYTLVSVVSCAVVYAVLWRIFSPDLVRAEGTVLRDETRSSLLMTVLLAVLLSCCFDCQGLFHHAGDVRADAVLLALRVCLLSMGIEYVTLRATLQSRERAELDRMLREGERHSALSRDLIDYVNRSVHDLKHALRSLETLPQGERSAFVEQTEKNLHAYQQMVFSDNETLNTLLTEKALLCEGRGVEFACSVGAVDVGFVSATDLYVLIGNMVDNAVEATESFSNADHRVVSLSLRPARGMLLISCDNPYDGELAMRDGLPLTTKADRARHGFGLRSMRLIAEKYGGNLSVGTVGHVFSVRVAVPVPPADARDR